MSLLNKIKSKTLPLVSTCLLYSSVASAEPTLLTNRLNLSPDFAYNTSLSKPPPYLEPRHLPNKPVPPSLPPPEKKDVPVHKPIPDPTVYNSESDTLAYVLIASGLLGMYFTGPESNFKVCHSSGFERECSETGWTTENKIFFGISVGALAWGIYDLLD